MVLEPQAEQGEAQEVLVLETGDLDLDQVQEMVGLAPDQSLLV